MLRTRNEIIEKAREYLDTPFRHQGRRKGIGIDCVGLPLCVGEDLGMIDARGLAFNRFDHSNYPAQPIGNMLAEEIAARAIEIPRDRIRPADIVTLRCGRVEMHVAIVSALDGGRLGLIHAYNGGPRCVTEHGLDGTWRARIVKAFRFPEVAD